MCVFVCLCVVETKTKKDTENACHFFYCSDTSMLVSACSHVVGCTCDSSHAWTCSQPRANKVSFHRHDQSSRGFFIASGIRKRALIICEKDINAHQGHCSGKNQLQQFSAHVTRTFPQHCFLIFGRVMGQWALRAQIHAKGPTTTPT